MRPITSDMLQQNNNNNYPCLNVSGSTREMLQKCSRASLPFPSRLELGLGDLPLIRGLRAWALCSKNRRKAGGLLGGTQAPTAPPVSRGGLTSCPRPADVCLSGEWSCMGYGLPMGLHAGQAGIGALVTVATLKKSEGSGKTQTQCLFLQTEKGSCLYSTTKPGSGVVGGWLRGKTGGGSRDTPAGRREHGPTPQAQTGANRVRLRSGRRWRKSCNTAGWERTGMSRESQQSSREDPGGEISLEERQEELDKGGLDSKQFPSLQQDIGRARQEKDGALRSLKCCHNASPKTCAQCGKSEHKGGESPRDVPNKPNSEVEGMRKERKKSEEEGDTDSAVPNPDLESNHFHPESLSGCDAEIRKAESNKEMKTEAFHSKDDCSRKHEDTNTEAMKIHANNDFIHGHGEQGMDNAILTGFDSRKLNEEMVNGFYDHVEAQQESDKDMEKVDVEEKLGTISQTPAQLSAVVSNCCESSVSIYPSSISITVSPEPSAPVEGSTCNAGHKTCVLRIQENSKDHLEGFQQGLADPGITGNEEFGQLKLNCADDENNTVIENRKPLFLFKNVEKSSQPEKRDASSSPLRHRHSSIFNTDGRIVSEQGCNCSTTELNKAERRERSEEIKEESQDETEQRVNPDKKGEEREICVSSELDGSNRKGDDNTFALKHSWGVQEFADGCRGRTEEVSDTCGQTRIIHVETNGETNTSVTNAACTDPSTSPALSLGNPAPSFPPLGSMETGLPCLEAEREEEEGVRETAGYRQGGQEGKRSPVRELVEQGKEERGSTVATEKEKKEEDDDEFGVFMQAEGELAWSKGSSMSASVPCGSRESIALGNHAITRESTHWTPGWTDSSFHQSEETWTAFPQDSSAEHQDVTGQWWPTSAVVERGDTLLTSQTLASVFTEAFPSSPGSSPRDPCNFDAVPTLTQLLKGKAKQDQGLLDSFHDLNKMICQRYQRPNGVSRDLLLRTLQLEQPHTEIRAALRTTNRRLSPGLPSANQHTQNAAAKRRLSYDYNRNIME